MRSPRAFVGGLVLLLGVPLAFATGVTFGVGAENVLHLAMAASFALLASAVFDFKLPGWINLVASLVAGALAAVFLLQGASDIMQSASWRRLAYDVLGQRLEKVLGYVFLLWCVALLLRDSAGLTRVVGGVVLVSILCVEAYSFALLQVGREAPGVLKLLYLPLFAWLLVEGLKPRRPRSALTTS